MAYKVFQKTAFRVDKATLAVTTDGRLALNAAAFRLFKNAGIKYVLLLWDQTGRKLALKGAPKSDKNAYAISASRRSGNIAAKMFFNHIGWSAAKRIRLDATWNERERMLEVTLPALYGSARRRDD